MPTKKPIDKRLKNLFEDLAPEQAHAEPKAAASPQTQAEAAGRVTVQPPTNTQHPMELAPAVSRPDSVMSLAFQAGRDSWATLQVLDETEERKWTQDEQLLVKQVADQLSLALENARLFQETQARAEELSVLNEMARELSTKLDVSAIAEVVYRYTGRLMDTRNFFFALYDEKNDEKSYPLVLEEGRRVSLLPSKLGNGGFSDFIIRNRRAVFAPNNVLGHMKTLGIEFIPLDQNDTPSKSWLGVPMMIGERVLGLISVQSVQAENVYDEHDRGILATIASQAAIAVENARLFAETQLRADEMARLNRLVTRVSETLDLQRNLQIIAEEIASFTSALHVGIALVDSEQSQLVLRADAPVVEGSSDLGTTIPIAGNPTAEPVIQNRTPLFINDVSSHPATRNIAHILRQRGTQSLFIWPIIVGREVIGTLGLDFADPAYELPENHKNQISTILFQTSTSIQNARLFEEARRRAQETAALAEVGREISGTLDLESVLTRIATYARELFQAESSALYLPQEDGAVWRAIAAVGAEAEEIKSDPINRDEGLLGKIVRRKLGQIVNDASANPGALTVKGTAARAYDHLMGVPILSGEKITGLMAVWRAGQGNEFLPGELDFLTSLARQAAIAIENARLYELEQYRRRIADTLSEMARIAGSSLNLQDVVQRLLEQLPRLVPFRTASIQLIEADGHRRQVGGLSMDRVRSQQLESPQPTFLRPIGEDPLVSEVVTSRQAVVLADTHQDPRWDLLPETREVRAWLGAPLLVGTQVIGLLMLDDTRPNAYTTDTLEIVQAFTGQAAIAIENARLFEEAETRAKELAILNQLAQSLSSQLNLSQVLDTIYSGIARLIDAKNFYIGFYDAESNEIIFPQNVTESDVDRYIERLPMGTGVTSYMIETGESILITDGTDEWMKAHGLPTAGAPSRSFLGVPLIRGGKTVGAMAVQNYEQSHAYDAHDLQLLTAFAGQVAVALENARLFDQVTSSQGRLSEALQIAGLGYFEIDPKENSVELTDELYALLGTSAEREGGYRFPIDSILPRFILEEDIPLASQAVQNAIDLKQDGDVTSEVRYKTADGRVIWVSSIYKIERDSQGTPVKIVGSSQDITERKTNELIQVAISQISEGALTAKTIEQLIHLVHEAISILLPAKNFYLGLYDSNSGLLSFPYHADAVDLDWSSRRLGKGLTSYVITTGRPLRVTPEVAADLVAAGEIVLDGTPCIDWLGVPLRSKQAVSGVIAIQTYDYEVRITPQHQEILSVIAPSVAGAIERFLAEREIQKFKLGIDRSNNAVFITDLDSVIQYTNPAFKTIYGYMPDEVVGKTPQVLKSDLTSQAEYESFWDTLLSGETVSHEITNRSKDGTLIPISATYSPILDETGKMMGFLAVHEDITERKLSEETLRRRNDYLAASSEIGRLVTSTLDLNTIFTRTVSLISERFGFYYAGIYIIEETGFNAVLREATGEAGEKMKAHRHSVIVGSNSVVGRVAANIEPMLVNDTDLEPLYMPNPYLLDTRAEVAIPLRIGTRIVGVIDIQSTQPHAFTQDDLSVLQSLADQVAVAIDNARSYELSQQLIQDLREIDLLKSQFLANMSHELRTPLNSIIGFSRVILKGIDGPVSEMQQQDLTAIYNSGQHLLGLINDILDLARIEAGKMELNFEEVHLAEMTTSVMSTAKGLVKEKPIQLLQRIPDKMPAVRGDAMRVRQVLLNLISNAAKFTESGSITVETTVQTNPSGKKEALINVVDTGPGISAEDQKKLFQAFSQVDGSATRKTGGTGLGLSICANLIQLHGGRIGVHSEVGKGSTFWFTLPLYQQPEEQIPDGKKVVLAIDDDPQVIGLYERYLSPQGYYVLPLTDPTKAREQILRIRPYAITLDIMMPNKDGWSVLTELKSDPATRDFPVIICSILEQADKGFSLGAADYLVKPILEEDLLHALDRLNKDGSIQEVLVIDDDPNDLRLIEKILGQDGRYKPILAQGGRAGWERINSHPPQAIILDLFMPEMDGFYILERLRGNSILCEIPVLVVSGGGLTNEQQQQLSSFGQQLISKGSLDEGQLIGSIETALKRLDP